VWLSLEKSLEIDVIGPDKDQHCGVKSPDAFSDSSDVLELQQVLTRYIDSQHGYEQAAELMERPDLAEAFEEVSARRRAVGERIALLIERKGERAEAEGSAEGAIHRWWIRLREKIADEELLVVLNECIRGEKVLLSSLQKAMTSPDIGNEEIALLGDAAEEVQLAIDHFEAAVKK
jgi:uncharacterized protein (TIGR02284 family)